MNRLLPRFAFLHCSCLIMTLSVTGWAQSKAPAKPDEAMTEAKRIEAEYRKLNDMPAAKELAELNAKLSASYQTEQKERSAAQLKMAEFRKTEAYQAYEKKRLELDRQQAVASEAARKLVADAARQLYSTRHAELRKLAATNRPAARPLEFDVLTYPRVDGSTSTHPLSVIIASHILGTAYEWIYPEPTGHPWHNRPKIPANLFLPGMPGRASDTAEGAAFIHSDSRFEFDLAASRTVAKPLQPGQQRVAIMINSLLAASSTTHDAYVNLIEGRCDLNLTARAMSADEAKLAADKGVKIKLEPIARDALVFIVNHKNPVKSLTTQQLPRIYTEKIIKWNEVGGAAEPLRALWRERNSGSRELFDALITSDHAPIPEPKERWTGMFSDSMSGPFNRVTQDAVSLGYSLYYYEHFMALSPYTRMLAINDVEPTPATIAAGQYPYVTEVYAAYRADDPATSPARQLLAWLLSPAGQAVVRESGYVPVK